MKIHLALTLAISCSLVVFAAGSNKKHTKAPFSMTLRPSRTLQPSLSFGPSFGPSYRSRKSPKKGRPNDKCPSKDPFGTLVQDFVIVANITSTPVQEVGRFLDEQSRAIDSVRPFLDAMLDGLPPEVVELLGARMDKDEFLLRQLMIHPKLEEQDSRRLVIDFDNPECIQAFVQVIRSFISKFLFTLGLGSLGNIIANTVTRKLAVNNALQLKIGDIWEAVPRDSQGAAVFQTALAILTELSMDGLLKEIDEAFDSWWERLRLIGKIAIDVGRIFLAVATGPVGVVLFFASFGLTIEDLYRDLEAFATCADTEAPTHVPTSRPTKAPTSFPTRTPTIEPTWHPTSQTSTVNPNAPSTLPNAPTPTNPNQPPTTPGNPTPNQPSSPTNPGSPSTPQEGETASTRATSDPHFQTWRGRFSYQGACDVVYVQTQAIAVHLRLSFRDSQRRFSFVSAVTISIGEDVLQVNSDKSYSINGGIPESKPTLGGTFPVSLSSSQVRVDLSGGQHIRVTYYLDTITLDITGHESTFGSSVGLAGSFFEDMVLGRNGVEMTDATPQAKVDEWKVDTSLDPELFDTPSEFEGQDHCESPTTFTSSSAERDEAEAACSGLPDAATREECIFDILATNGDTQWASNPGFTQPLDTLENVCLASTTEACSNSGGTCVWRCNTNNFNCVESLCNATSIVDFDDSAVSSNYADGCSCAIPFPPPSASPTDFPTRSDAGVNDFMTCISVIDEVSVGNSAITNSWTRFRDQYPDRSFCLLDVPSSLANDLIFRPPDFVADPLTTYSVVNRDEGDVNSASDWFDICGLGDLKSKGITRVAVFIDNSGSMYTSSVQASFNLFQQRLTAEGITLVDGIYNNNEEWIQPFFRDDF